jgi:hypothetical protein
MFQSPNAVQVGITLDEVKPKVWRRLILPANWNLEQLHLSIQAAFNWWNYHLNEFDIGGLRYGDVELLTAVAFGNEPRVFDFREILLPDFRLGATLRYLYDFGDGWRHTIAIENFLTLDTTPKHGVCTGGARARPPEHVGGVGGYERFLQIISDKSDPEYAETKQWCGGHFDPEWFDLAVINKDLKSAAPRSKA